MATNWVLSECGFRPPKIYPQSRTTPPSKSFNLFRLRSSPASKSSNLCPSFWVSNFPKRRNWALNVAAPVNVNGEGDDVSDEKSEKFDPGAPPPFTLADIRAAIPKHCWVSSTWRSMSYVLRDVVIIFGLAAVASYFNNWLVWPLYWFCQGTMFWALFVIGHDCGHGSFSNDRNLNTVIGHFVNCTILVPYHGWRISHRTHHQHQGHAEYDESWHPPSETTLKNLDNFTKTMRFILPFQLLAFPFYLLSRSPGKKGSHFDPNGYLFLPKERNDIITSTACCIAMAALLVYLCFVMGPFQMLKLYGVPYWIFVMWLDLVTYLNHHGYEEKVPWYRGKEWSYFRGGLTTIDRDYGLINNIHHDIGTHVVHHLFPQIPHYHLVEATEAAKPVLGKYYREPEKSGPLPLHLIGTLVRSLNEDHYVSDTEEVLYYQKDPNMYKKSE